MKEILEKVIGDWNKVASDITTDSIYQIYMREYTRGTVTTIEVKSSVATLFKESFDEALQQLSAIKLTRQEFLNNAYKKLLVEVCKAGINQEMERHNSGFYGTTVVPSTNPQNPQG